jgi:SAM-dependent methyltransferase
MIYVVAEDAVRSLADVLDGIPDRVRERVSEILVFDAGSRDATYLVGMGYKAVSGAEKLTVLRGPRGGVGEHNKRAISYCQEREYDVMVLLHGDGKYAPEVIETLIDPVASGEVDAAFGTRFLDLRAARAGMPLYKYLGIRAFTILQNRILHRSQSEYHCGYRAYRLAALADLPFERNASGIHFDTELAIQLHQRGLRIAEVPVPTYSGDETRSLRGVVYGFNVLRSVFQYWLHVRGLREFPKYDISEKYVYKASPEASHQKILALVEKDRQTILDVGCGAGFLAQALSLRGNTVTGVDARKVTGAEERMDRFIHVELERDPIPWTGPPFQIVVLADILEHLSAPDRLLQQCHKLLANDGVLIVSVPNVAHWSVRLSLLFGRFVYTARGILDRSHLRFFTLSSICSELERAGFAIDRVEATVPPFEDLMPGGPLRSGAHLLNRLQALGNKVWKQAFAYQFVLRASKRAD